MRVHGTREDSFTTQCDCPRRRGKVLEGQVLAHRGNQPREEEWKKHVFGIDRVTDLRNVDFKGTEQEPLDGSRRWPAR